MKRIYLVTKSFPYGNEERSFLGPEYECLKAEFDITLVTTEVDPKNIEAQDNCKNVVYIKKQRGYIEKVTSLCRFLLQKDCYREIGKIVKTRKNVTKRIGRALMFGSAAETFYRRLKKSLNLQRGTEAIMYFYWYDYKCFGMTMHKHQYHNIRVIARTHGYDLYDERELYGKQFFKEQMDRELERLIFAAAFAKEYYLKRYQKCNGQKYPLYRLGVSEKGMSVQYRKREFEENSFLLLSCSHTITIKRVELIIEALALINKKNICWIHLGNGEQFEFIRMMAEQKLEGKENISFKFYGEIPNDDVIRFYKEHYVGAFITTTSTEGGSPVSVQEALSFGVPIIATAVGELPIMVEGNGILLSKNPSKEEVATSIEKVYDLYGTDSYFNMCGRSLEIFEDKFNAHYNYTKLKLELQMI